MSSRIAAATGHREAFNPEALRLKIGIYSEADQWLTAEQLAPFLQAIEKGMARQLTQSVQIDLYMYQKRESLEAIFLRRLIDVVRIGEGPLVRLRRLDASITPLVQQVSGGKTSVVFVAASSPITDVAGLKRMRFAAGNPTSTSSGYKLLEHFLQAGLRNSDLDFEPQENAEDNVRLRLGAVLVREGGFGLRRRRLHG